MQHDGWGGSPGIVPRGIRVQRLAARCKRHSNKKTRQRDRPSQTVSRHRYASVIQNRVVGKPFWGRNNLFRHHPECRAEMTGSKPRSTGGDSKGRFLKLSPSTACRKFIAIVHPDRKPVAAQQAEGSTWRIDYSNDRIPGRSGWLHVPFWSADLSFVRGLPVQRSWCQRLTRRICGCVRDGRKTVSRMPTFDNVMRDVRPANALRASMRSVSGTASGSMQQKQAAECRLSLLIMFDQPIDLLQLIQILSQRSRSAATAGFRWVAKFDRDFRGRRVHAAARWCDRATEFIK